MIRKLSAIDTVVIHCADTDNGSPRWGIADIDAWHKARGFRRDPEFQQVHGAKHGHVGYHRVIHVDGSENLGRSLLEVGAHAEGFNSRSVGICMMGRDRFTRAQWDTLRHTVRQLQAHLVIRSVVGHRDVNPNKNCPGFDVAAWLAADMQPTAAHIFRRA